MSAAAWRVERLDWSDAILGEIALPGGTMVLRSGFGSGMTRRRGDPLGLVWAVSDRGPNLKVRTAMRRYGLAQLAPLARLPGAKLMPRPDIGPEIAQLRVAGDAVELVRTLRLSAPDGTAISGLPPAGGDHLLSEPVFDLNGNAIAADGGGLDTEGIAALGDGGFWVSEEFGPSLVRLDEHGTVVLRLVPAGVALDSPYPVVPSLPAIAAKRQLNRGFEAVALSDDQTWLFLAFQSPLAHPDEAAHEAARHVRLWRLEAATGAFAAQYLYPLDPPQCFRRDAAAGDFGRSDIKVSELAWLGGEALLVLERGSVTTKIYRVELGSAAALEPRHLDAATRPTVEQLSAASGEFPLPVLAKTLLFDSDEAPQVAADIEGMALLSERELLLVSDNDFGVEGAETGFWRVTFAEAVLA